MLIKIVPAPGQPGGRALMLCDDAGEPLPMQRDVSYDQRLGEAPTLTVTFTGDGERIRLAD